MFLPILFDDLLGGLVSAILIEDYFDAIRGPTVLVGVVQHANEASRKKPEQQDRPH